MFDAQANTAIGQRVGEPLGPLDGDHCVSSQKFVETDRLKIARADAPRVDVNQRTVATAMIHAQREGWTRDRGVVCAQTVGKTAHQRRLSRAEIARQQHDDCAWMR